MNRLVAALPLIALGAGAAAALAAPTPSRPARPQASAAGARIPARPDALQFKPLHYDPPSRTDHRHVLPNGVVVYVVEDSTLPLVDVVVTTRGGDYLDPDGKEGLAALTADQMRSGGAGIYDARAFDEAVDFLAANLAVASGPRECTASLNVLSKDLGPAMDLLLAALRSPRFQQDRIDLARSKLLQAFAHRNDDTRSIEQREWLRLAYGADHFESKRPTSVSLAALTRDDLVAFHDRLWNPANFIISVAGDVKAADVLADLQRRFDGWPGGNASAPAPRPTHRPEAGLYVVNKDDVNQSRVSLGHLATTWDDPNHPALDVMNEILGGGAFTSHVVRRVRSDEGLAYSANTAIGFGRDYPRTFRAAFQSKNRSVSRALALTLEEMRKMQEQPVNAKELATAKSSFIETFPQKFATPRATAALFVEDELYGRPASYWFDYRPAIEAVTVADVQRVATQYLHPDQVAILVVGKVAEVRAGDPDHPDFTLERLAGERGVLEIPLPDPSTLVYPHEPRALAAATKAGN